MDSDNNEKTYYMPAEWTPHQRTLTAFPELPGTYGDAVSLEVARLEVAAIANAIAQCEPVWLYCTAQSIEQAKTLVSENVTIKEAAVDNLWIRDLGPVFVRESGNGSKGSAAIDFNFNYWGNKVEPTVDPSFARRMLGLSDFNGVARHVADIVSEGGALEVDGEGTLLVTDSSVVNPNRNPGVSREAIERELKRVLGVIEVVWLKGVMGLESTDWHVDAFARFVGPGRVVLSRPPTNAHSKLHEVYDAALETLANARDAKGRKFEVHSCQEPDQETLPKGHVEGMVTSYVNYLLVNGGLIMAKFGQLDTDDAAKKQLGELFPGRRIVQVEINELPKLGGGIHCATQQVPQ